MTRRALIAAPTLLAVLLVAAPARADWVWPVSGEVITPYRNGDDPYASGQHRGIDIAADLGTPVVAAAGGDVRFAGTAGSSGVTVSIRTADDLFDTSYLHLSSATVRKGQRLAAGELIGAVGTSGVRSAERPHLHFGVRDAGSRHAYHDPLGFLPPVGLTPERPRPTPIPAPAPLPMSPAPEPLRGRAPAPRPEPIPRRVPLPHGATRRLRADRRSARPRPEPIPRFAPVSLSAPRGAPATGNAPSAARVPHAHAGPAAQGAASGASLGSETRHGPSSARRHTPAGGDSAPRPEALRHRARASTPAPGPDIGWALACLGLLLAAAILGLSEHGRNAGRRSGRLAGVLRPLWGRR